MKILIVLGEINYRGVSKYFADLSAGLAKRHNKIEIFAARVEKEPKKLSEDVRLVKNLIPINTLFANNLVFVLLSMPFTLFYVLKHARTADIIYVDEHFFVLWPSVIAGFILHKPVVWFVFESGLVRLSHDKHLLYYLYLIIYGFLNKFAVKGVSGAVTIDKDLVSFIKQRYGLKKVELIVQGLDFNNYPGTGKTVKDKMQKFNDKKIILIVGIVHPIKKQDYALKIFAEVNKAIPDTFMIIAGEQKPGYINHLKNLVKKLGVEKEVIFTGIITDNELKNYYLGSDLILQTGYIVGYTVLEALMYGKMPVYSSKGKPSGSIFADMGLGIAIDKEKTSAYVKAIVDYLMNKRKYNAKLKKDRAFVFREFTMDKFCDKTTGFLQDILENQL